MNTNIIKVLSRLQKVSRFANGRFKACCPAHDDASPSLAIKYDGDRLLLHCFAGCSTENVLKAIDLDWADIMPTKAEGHSRKDEAAFYAGDVLRILQFEAMLTFIYASDMANGASLSSQDKKRLLLAAARINHAHGLAKNGL